MRMTGKSIGGKPVPFVVSSSLRRNELEVLLAVWVQCDLEGGDEMKQLRICYTKLIMLDVEDDVSKEEIRELVETIASEEIFIDGEYDEVEWEVY